MVLPSFVISVSKNVIFHLQKQNLSCRQIGEKAIWYIVLVKIWSILIQDISRHTNKDDKWRKDTKDKEATVSSPIQGGCYRGAAIRLCVFSKSFSNFIAFPRVYEMFSSIRYYLYNLKNVNNTHGGVLLLIMVQAFSAACNFTKCNTPLWVFFTSFKLYKWYQIAQRSTYNFTVSG